MRRPLSSIIILGIMVGASALSSFGDSDDAIISKLSTSLEMAGISISEGRIITTGGDQPVDILVRFREGHHDSFVRRMKMLGADLGYAFDSLDLYQVKCPGRMIKDISTLYEVVFIEYDAPGTFDMDVSSAVVNAPEVWSSLIGSSNTYRNGVTGEGYSIAVVDSGIDAGHPDLDIGTKTLKNIKAVRAGDPWVEMENTDTSIGHGSHCAGIAAGNGDASAGARRGIAPGANLIGLSLTEGDEEISTSNYLYGLEWVYENSKKHSNPYNIRVCTNSWHTTVGEYEPEMSLSRIVNKLTYENNVVCTFSAGNDGRNDPEGNEIWTSQQGNVPGAIMVAAYARDGSSVAEFTSHGKVGLNHTYPDVGAPGVRIWASHARRTGISAGSKLGGNPNPYYLAISGTSMSTPQVAGAVALLFEACPSLTVSRIAEDYNGNEPDWFHGHEYRFVHEAEIILEASATPLPYIEGQGKETGIFVDDPSTGWGNRNIDYTQGYGMIDLEKAIGISLALNELRTRYKDRYVDVFDALMVYEGGMTINASVANEKLTSSWKGEYSRFNDQNGKPLIVQNQTKYVYIPEGATSLRLTIQYDFMSLSRLYIGGITVDVDKDLDGEPDTTGGLPIISQPGTYDIPVSQTETYYGVTVRGQGLKLTIPSRETSYVELRIPYTIMSEVNMDGGGGIVPCEVYSASGNAHHLGTISNNENGTELGLRVYDMKAIGDPFSEYDTEIADQSDGHLWLLLILFGSAMAILIFFFTRKRRRHSDHN